MRKFSINTGPIASLFLVSLIFASGCQQSGSRWSNVTSAVSFQGRVSTGDQAISNSEVQIYVAGTDGVGSTAQTLLAEPVRTDSNGNFSISDAVTCPSGDSKIYIAARGGNPGLIVGADNDAILLMSMLGACSDLVSNTAVSINEVTTVGSVSPMSSYMASVPKIGGPSSDPSFREAVARVSQLIDTSHGTSPGTDVPDGYMVQDTKLNALANILSACVKSPGGRAGDGSICGALFTLATPSGGDAPTNTAMAALRIAQDPTVNVGHLFALMQPESSPFQPSLYVAPDNWAVTLVAATGKSLFISVANIGVGTSKTGTVNLPAAAVANVPVSLVSKNPGYVSVSPATLTILKGAKTAAFTYVGRAVGITAITASASRYTAYTRGLAAVPATPSYTLASGTYAAGSSVGLSSTGGAVIHYTLNGSTPTSGSSTYSKPIVLTSAVTLRAIAVINNQASAVASASYAIASSGTHLVFAIQPVSTPAGMAFAPSVRILDALGNLVASSAAITLSLANNPGNATLGGTTTVAAGNGIANFPGITVSAAGSGYTLNAVSPGSTSVVSAGFAITANSNPNAVTPGYYVSNSGSDSNAGTSAAAPWKTIAKANAAKMAAGSSIYLQCGSTFREVMTIFYTGTAALPLNYTSYGNCTGSNRPLISGADLLSSWNAEGDGLFTSYYSSEATSPSVVFENNHRLPLVAAKLLLTKGTSFYDAVNKRVYVRTLEDGSPVGRTIEANVRMHPVAATARNHFRITGLEVDKSSQNAMIFTGTMTDVQIIDTVTNYNKATGIRFSANAGQTQSDVLIKGCVSSYNGEDGVTKGNGGNNFIIDGCTANYDGFDPAYIYSGALHIVSDGLHLANRVTNSGIRNSTAGWAGVNPDTGVTIPVSKQSGVGIWCDTCGAGSFLLHNVAHDSVQAGVQMEFSGTVGSRTVGYNISYRNMYGILHIRRSHNDLITNNTAWDNSANCEFSGEYGGNEKTIGMVGNIYQNNICASQVLNSSGVVLVAQYGAENNALGEGSKNIYRKNSFGVPTATSGVFAFYGTGQKKTSYAALDTAYKARMNSIEGDPLLNSPSTGDFSLRAGSPAIGSGYGGGNIGAIPYTP